jgi:putative hydrolase of the HAD superfamily
MIKAIVFDLDNTLLNTDEISYRAYKSTIKILHETGISEDKLSRLNCEYRSGVSFTTALELVKDYIPHDTFKIAITTYLTKQNVSKIKPTDDNYFEILLSFMGGPQASPVGCAQPYLVTKGDFYTQRKKIHYDCIHTVFSPRSVYYIGKNESKEGAFREIMKKRKCLPSEVLVVGDNPEDEIKIGNMLGMRTMRYHFGRHSKTEPTDKLEIAERDVKSLEEVLEFVRNENMSEWKSLEACGFMPNGTLEFREDLFGYGECKNRKVSDIIKISDGFDGLPVDALPSDYNLC